MDLAIASSSPVQLYLKHYTWPIACQVVQESSMPRISVEKMYGPFSAVLGVLSTAALLVGILAVLQRKGKIGRAKLLLNTAELMTHSQVQRLVANVVANKLASLEADILEDVATEFGTDPIGSGNRTPNRTPRTPTRTPNRTPRCELEDFSGLPVEETQEDEMDEFSDMKEALSMHGPRYFKRYDMDASGTINNEEELKLLCTNLVYKLGLAQREEDVHQAMKDVDFGQIDGWTYPTFEQWFVENLINKHVSPAATIGMSIRAAGRKAKAPAIKA